MRTASVTKAIRLAAAALALAALAGCGPASPAEACQGHRGVSWSQINPNLAHCKDGSAQPYM